MVHQEKTKINTSTDRNMDSGEHINLASIVLAFCVAISILIVLISYTIFQRKNVIENAEQVTNQTAEYIASNIANEIGYADSSIKLAAVTIAQTMTSEVLENPAQVILPMIENTPFGGIEYIRADGMNVMNIGEPFDASDRVYYIEGIKGNTGVWNNYHPKTSQETLVNFYTPLIYDGQTVGVITGYIEANGQIVPLFEKKLYDQEIYGLLVDENNMVICSTEASEYVKDLTLDMYVERYDYSPEQLEYLEEILATTERKALSYKELGGDGRICSVLIPGTQWKVVIMVPEKSFRGMIRENTHNSVIAVTLISVILVAYSAYILLRNAKRRKAITVEKNQLQYENLEIRDIIASADMGTWHIELMDDQEPRMYVDDTMRKLLGITDKECSPEETYTEWFSNIVPDAVPSVLYSVDRMKQGFTDENTYLWKHPEKGSRYVRCGGTAQKLEKGYVLRGYHYDVDEVVREEQTRLTMLCDALNEKNEYYTTLGTLEGIFYSMHVIHLEEDTVIEFNTQNLIREIVNHPDGATEMMHRVMHATISDDYLEDALAFTELQTVAERMKDKKIISMQIMGKNVGWILASFIAMERDKDGNVVKVIFTTRVIDEEKKQEEQLIRKSQTDELTGLFNRRAYEEDIHAHNDTPSEDDFVYISLDVNGLKVVNDSEGHMAGDELIIGACQCMKKSLGSYGRIYRTGGDEFVAIIFSNSQKLQEILADFDETIAGWKGELIDGLSISYGWICKTEQPELSVRQLGAIAEQRMYAAKEAYYKRAGFDRRGQKDAHKALCDLYTKILKINVTDDSFAIVNMDESERTQEMGYTDTISEWLRAFGESGQVHPEDLEEYLKYTSLDYISGFFAGNKTSLHIFYRRRFGEEFKQVMMELIPAGDYSPNHQSLFLYVKNIEK